jgi:hypothetical protein
VPNVRIITEDEGTEESGYDSPNGSGPDTPPSGPDFNVILGAPDLATLIKRSKTGVAREYEKKTASAFKAVALGSIQSGNLPDAAAVLWHGPGAASAIGDLASADEHARKALDMLLAPDNPWLVCALTIIPLIGQLARNHEPALKEIPGKFKMGRKARAQRKLAKAAQPPEPPRFTFKLFGKTIPVRFKMHNPFGPMFKGIRSQTRDPDRLTAQVFSDDKLLAELRKHGVDIRLMARE